MILKNCDRSFSQLDILESAPTRGSDYVAVIQAGGKGTRMIELTKDEIPKPMLLINGKPMLQWQMENVQKYGIKEFVIIVGHLGEKIQKYFGDGDQFGVHIRYIWESEPLGSAGALYYLKDIIQNKGVLLIFGDVMFDIDWNRMITFHEEKKGVATLLVHPNSHPKDSDLVIMDEDQHVMGIDSKSNKRDYWYDNCVNAGLYILSADILLDMTEAVRTDLEKDLLRPFMKQGLLYGYRTTEYVKDAGTISRYYEVCKEQQLGIWVQRSLKNKQKCVFLDRDGTINKFCGLLSREEQFELEEGVAEAIRLLNSSEYLAIVITNQPVVARGMCGMGDVERIHKKMQTLLGEQGAYLDDIAFCPHHPDKGFPEENPCYKIPCNCRKPATGMIQEMKKKYNIDMSNSYMIGDSTVDIQTGKNAGIKTILLSTGQGGCDGKYEIAPDDTAKDLLTAVQKILN